MFDARKIRNDFPILKRTVHGKPLVYLDNAATTQKPASVIALEKDYYEQFNANIHRGIHALSEEATAAYEAVREKVAALIGAPASESVIFTKNATEAVNLVAYGWARKNLKPKDEIILSTFEHHSNLVPWQQAAAVTGAQLRFVPPSENGEFDVKTFEKVLSKKTKLVAMTAMSNVLGTIVPVGAIVERAHAMGAKVLIDGAQAIPHLAMNVTALRCDWLVFSAHKMLGPTGVGVLWGKPDVLDEMDVFLTGGDMIVEVWQDKARWNELPWKFEAGTPNIAGVIAFGAALDYINTLGMDAIRNHEKELVAYAIKKMKDDSHIQIYGPLDPEKRGGVISFNYGTIHPHDLGTLLDQEGVAIRAGHHCCQPLMRDLGVSGTARASFYIYNTPDDIDALLAALKKAATVFAAL